MEAVRDFPTFQREGNIKLHSEGLMCNVMERQQRDGSSKKKCFHVAVEMSSLHAIFLGFMWLYWLYGWLYLLSVDEACCVS